MEMIIGVDHGYSAMKTARHVFPTGLVVHDYPPFTRNNVLEYGGKYYIIGSGRQPLQKDKTQTENYYLLTLAAIAREILVREAQRDASVHLAAGLPLTGFGRDRDRFREYLLRDRQPVSFRFSGQDFRVVIERVSLFPQGYAAALTQRELTEAPSVNLIDIGGWTCDLMRLNNHIPDAATCRSLEQGVIRCMDEVTEQIRRNFGLSVSTAQIESVMSGNNGTMEESVAALINRQASDYVQRLLSAISETGMDIYASPTIFMGGGAMLVRRYASRNAPICRPRFLEDTRLNAQAFELLARQMT